MLNPAPKCNHEAHYTAFLPLYPLQLLEELHLLKDLQGMGIQPDILVCRSEHPLDDNIKSKIALFCNVPKTHVLQNLDVEVLYEVPLVMEEEHLAQVACECLNLPCPEPDLKDWTAMIDAWKHPEKDVTVALVGKYTQLHDAYISVVEALKHGALANQSRPLSQPRNTRQPR